MPGKSKISQALNKGNKVALKTTEISALAVLTGAVTTHLETAVAERVKFETVREAVRAELDFYVDDPEFIELFEFVVSQGATLNSFVPMLLDYGARSAPHKLVRYESVTFSAHVALRKDVFL